MAVAKPFRYIAQITDVLRYWRTLPEFEATMDRLERRDRDLEDYISRAAIVSSDSYARSAFGAGSTNSATYVDMPGPVDIAFVKRYPDTPLKLTVQVSAYKTTNAGLVTIGLRINSTDYDCAAFFFNTLSEHNTITGFGTVAAGLPVGSYTARLRWKTANDGANVDTNDFYNVSIQEVSP